MQQQKLLAASIAMVLAVQVTAQTTSDENTNVEEVLVLGTDFNLQGTPETATEGIVYQQQLALRPVSRTAELLEFVPGMIATQHSGEGKANQYFVRGFNLDHGTDFAIILDRMPVNMPSHGHGQGYADINFIIPELVSTMRYRKGPYYASGGDFATAGAAGFVYADALEQGEMNLTMGENNYRRLFAGNSFDVPGGQLTIAGALTGYHGPWELDQSLHKRKGLIKYHQQDVDYSFSVTGMTYRNAWDSTDQIPLRAVEDGRIGVWGNIDPTAGGDSRRNSLSMDWTQQLANNANWRFSAYMMDYALDLYSNFTYFDADPVRGDQFQQTDSRRVAGFDTEYSRMLDADSIPVNFTVGFQHRYDDIHVGLHKSEQRRRYASTRDDYVEQSLSSLYASLEHEWTDRLRSVSSLRLDNYSFDVTDLLGINGGSGSDFLLSPKLNLVYSPADGVETFLSAGQGFHSNDARGATISIDPVSGDPVAPVDPLATARSYELGLRTSVLPKTQLAVTAFSMKLSSELIYVGDEGTTEAVDPSQREGIEISFLYTPLDWLLFDGDATYTRARLQGVGPDDRIPNAVRNTASLGMIVDDINSSGWSGGMRLRYLGTAPLIEDNSVRTESTFLVNAQISKALTPNMSLSLELLNVLDSRDTDITYFYESRLPGEAAAIEDIHFHPAEPRSIRATLSARF